MAVPPDAQRGVFIVYGRSNCQYCDKALDLLSSKNRSVNYRSTKDDEHYEFLSSNGFTLVPQIWHGTHYVGGYDKLVEYLNADNVID